MRALITGANGFIGAALTHRLLRDGVAVRAMCRTVHKGDALRRAGAEVVAGDLHLIDTLHRAVDGCEVVYHVGAALGGAAAYQYNVSALGTLNMLRAAQAADVGRVVHVSSIAVYGMNCYGTVTEDYPRQPSPHDYYQQAKSLAEDLLWDFAAQHALPVTCVRPGMVYGPGSGFWSKRLYALMRRIPMPVVGDGQGHAHPIFIDDLVDLLVTASAHPAAVGGAFNGTPDPAPTWTTFLGHYAAMANNTRTVHLAPAWLRSASPLVTALTRWQGEPLDLGGMVNFFTRRLTYSMQRAADVLGWRARVTLPEGMALTERWLRAID